MSDVESSDASLAPFVVEFTLAVILSLKGLPFYRPQKQVIHADIVPRFSEQVVHASMRERIITPQRPLPKTLLSFSLPQQVRRPVQPQAPRVEKPVATQPLFRQQVTASAPVEFVWQKIQPLLDDPTVTHIECQGPNTSLMVSRSGQRQITKITLSDEEIKKILETVSEQAHIPLLEGVFRAMTDSFSISAVISELVGSKFVIKKNTPYSLLEQ